MIDVVFFKSYYVLLVWYKVNFFFYWLYEGWVIFSCMVLVIVQLIDIWLVVRQVLDYVGVKNLELVFVDGSIVIVIVERGNDVNEYSVVF